MKLNNEAQQVKLMNGLGSRGFAEDALYFILSSGPASAWQRLRPPHDTSIKG
jgi:hypothetical protein